MASVQWKCINYPKKLLSNVLKTYKNIYVSHSMCYIHHTSCRTSQLTSPIIFFNENYSFLFSKKPPLSHLSQVYLWSHFKHKHTFHESVLPTIGTKVTKKFESQSHLNFSKDILSCLFSTSSKTYNEQKSGESNSKLSNEGSSEPKKSLEEEEEAKIKEREAYWRTMKLSFLFLGATFGICGGYLVYELGPQKRDADGNLIEDEFSHLPPVKQFFSRIVAELQSYNKMLKKPSNDKLLPDPLEHPYHQPPYTLVLELTDLLVHPDWTYQTGWRFKKRPNVGYFLEQVGPPLFEIVIYTAEQGLTMYPIIDSLDPKQLISYRLVRDATDFIDGHHVKNLDCINRDLNKVIVVDWNAESVKLHPNNVLVIPRWKGQDNDRTLIDLAAFLRTIALNNVDDVREVLAYYRQFDDPIETFKENQRKFQEQLEEKQRQEEERKKNKALAAKWSGSLFSSGPKI